MPAKDAHLEHLVDRLGEHYKANIYSQFLKNSLVRMQLETGDWDKVNSLVDVPEYTRLQGFRFMDLYEQILAMARFLRTARAEVLPGLGASVGRTQLNDQQAILRNMAIGNFGSNLRIFADMLNEIYVHTVALDKQEHSGGRPDLERLPELKEIGNLLVDR